MDGMARREQGRACVGRKSVKRALVMEWEKELIERSWQRERIRLQNQPCVTHANATVLFEKNHSESSHHHKGKVKNGFFHCTDPSYKNLKEFIFASLCNN